MVFASGRATVSATDSGRIRMRGGGESMATLWSTTMQTATRSILMFLGFGLLVATATALPWQPTEPVKPDGGAKPDAPAAASDGGKASQPAKAEPAAVDAYVLGHTVKDIDGKDQKLDQYKGQVVMIVNVASKCGYTRQYAGLEALYKKYKDQGLVVLGFPSNDFGGQEPGTEAEIKQFCTSKFGVTFPMFGKVGVTGGKAHPLFKQLAAQKGEAGGEPKWNFNKYLVDRDGKAVEHLESGMKPDSEELARKLEALLDAKPAAQAAPAAK
jgi:glutathione peroxidase